MANLNKVILIGHMTAEPELKLTPSGIAICSFSIGINRKFSKSSEQKTDFIDIVAWRKQAEFVKKYFKKGSAICICGSLQSRSWTDNNGNKRYATEVVADEVSFVERKNETAKSDDYITSTTNYPFPDDPDFEEMSDDDDLPY